MKIVTILLNISFCLKCCLSTSHANNFKMIIDFINSYEQPTAVFAMVCWDSVGNQKFAKTLAEGGINVRFSRHKDMLDDIELNNHLLFLVDMGCSSSKAFLVQASAKKMFTKTFRWLVLGNINVAMTDLNELSILVDSEFVVANKKENGDYILHAIYKVKVENNWLTEYYGTWTAIKGLNKSEDRAISTVMRRKDLKGTPLRATLVATDDSTRHNYAELRDIFIDPVTKSTYHTNKNLYDFLNATKMFTFSDTWGYFINGTWSGIMADMQYGKSDLCGSILFMNEERRQLLNYITIPAAMSNARIVFKQPPLSYQHNLFVLPFTSGVWYTLGGFVMVLTVILYINAKWDIQKHEHYHEENKDSTCLEPAWSDVIIFLLSAISQQGSSNELKGTLGRIVMFIIFLVFVFLYTSYSASIVVLLQATSDQIRTVTDFTNSKLELGIEDVPYNKYYFSAMFARDPVRKAFYDTKVAPRGAKPTFMSLEEGIKTMQTKPFAFNMNLGTGYWIVSKYFQEHEKCMLREVDYVQATNPWICCSKHTPFIEMFRVGFNRIEEHGLSARHNLFLFAKKPPCSVSGGNFGSVNMVDFYPVLLLLVYGMILAFALLLLEILVHRKLKMRDNARVEQN